MAADKAGGREAAGGHESASRLLLRWRSISAPGPAPPLTWGAQQKKIRQEDKGKVFIPGSLPGISFLGRGVGGLPLSLRAPALP